jgi:hypothetical protein
MSIEGERNFVTRLTNATVKDIRSLYVLGDHSYADLAWWLDVHRSTIQKIINGERWHHLLEPDEAETLARVREQRRNDHNLKNWRYGNG